MNLPLTFECFLPLSLFNPVLTHGCPWIFFVTRLGYKWYYTTSIFVHVKFYKSSTNIKISVTQDFSFSFIFWYRKGNHFLLHLRTKRIINTFLLNTIHAAAIFIVPGHFHLFRKVYYSFIQFLCNYFIRNCNFQYCLQ